MSAVVRVVRGSDVAACPKFSLLPAHYRDDGTCRCADRDLARARVDEARAALDKAHDELRDAQADVRNC